MFRKEKYMLERSIMVLYHGSPESRAKKIIEKGEISNWCERIWKGNLDGKDIGTTDGYIYLSDKIIILGLRDNINNKGLCKWEIIIFRRTEKETVILLKGL